MAATADSVANRHGGRGGAVPNPDQQGPVSLAGPCVLRISNSRASAPHLLVNLFVSANRIADEVHHQLQRQLTRSACHKPGPPDFLPCVTPALRLCASGRAIVGHWVFQELDTNTVSNQTNDEVPADIKQRNQSELVAA